MRHVVFAVFAAACLAGLAAAQQPAPPPAAEPAPAVAPISLASVEMQGVTLSGYIFVRDGRAIVGNDTSITAGDQTAHVALTRGGSLDVCATTKIHLATDNTTVGGALMFALDRGAFEAHYTPGQYSDVILTPDLRILISPPGQADLSLRVNQQGDTCIDNHGDNAPYVTASSLFSGGAYRIQPNQRVLFEHGSINEVVDTEQEPCGCPSSPPQSVAAAPAAPSSHRQTAASAAAQNPFPLATSEGLAPTPPPPTTPVVPPGQTHAEVQVPIVYNANNPAPAPPPTAASSAAPTPAPQPKPHRGFFGHIGHFFARIFGGK